MKEYKDWSPMSCDRAGLNCPDQQDWLVAPVVINRDSILLAEHNWGQQNEALDEIDPDEKDHGIVTFNHWAVGWVEFVLVRPGTPAAAKAAEIEAKLENYHILNEDAYSEAVFDATCEVWEKMSLRERVEMCQEVGANVFSARRDAIPELCLPKVEEYATLY